MPTQLYMKPSGKVELLIITQMPPFRTSWLYLASPFLCAKIRISERKTKFILIFPNECIFDEVIDMKIFLNLQIFFLKSSNILYRKDDLNHLSDTIRKN